MKALSRRNFLRVVFWKEIMNYLDYFKKIAGIPHGSGNTKMISDYLKDFAKERDLECYQDDLNNIIIEIE